METVVFATTVLCPVAVVWYHVHRAMLGSRPLSIHFELHGVMCQLLSQLVKSNQIKLYLYLFVKHKILKMKESRAVTYIYIYKSVCHKTK